MLRLYASYVLMISEEMHKFSATEWQGVGVTWNQEWLTNSLKAFITHAKDLGLPVTAAAAQRFLHLTEKHSAAQAEHRRLEAQDKSGWLWKQLSPTKGPPLVETKDFVQHAKNVIATFRDELDGLHILVLPSGHAAYYQQEEPLFGTVVSTQFPGLAEEIREAGKCYALGRSTATVFHSIRCLEAGINALSRCLGIPDPTKGAGRSWASLLKAIGSEMEKRWPPGQARFTGDGKTFEEIYAVLAALQNPYRNATMHLDATYTAQEALDIMNAVKRLMISIASRMDENGLPKA